MSLVIYKGIPWTYRLTATIKGTTTRQNLAGIPLRFEVKKHGGDPALITLNVGTGITLLDQTPLSATEGQADFFMSGVTTNTLEAGMYECNLVGAVAGLDRLIIPPLAVLVRAI